MKGKHGQRGRWGGLNTLTSECLSLFALPVTQLCSGGRKLLLGQGKGVTIAHSLTQRPAVPSAPT